VPIPSQDLELEAGTVCLSLAPGFTPVFGGVHVANRF
jgi:hypothetical protein